jgi:branched-chain amino acid transport system permease protein
MVRGVRHAVVGVVGLITLAMVPLVGTEYHVLVVSQALVLAIACLGFNLLLGHAGLLSLGHTAYFGLGAYTGGMLFTFGDVTSFELYAASGILCAIVVAVLVGAITVRTRGIFFTLQTLAFTQLVQASLVSGLAFRPFGGMGKGFFLIGHGGLYLPRFTLAGQEVAAEHFSATFYYVIAVAFVAAALLIRRIIRSPFGTALRATRDNELRARFIGLDVPALRLRAFVLAAGVMAVAGALFGQLVRQITPEQVGWFFAAEIAAATVLGGTRWVGGPVLGAFAMVALREAAFRYPVGYRFVLGSVLIAIVMAAPGGLAALAARVWGRVGGRRLTPDVSPVGGGERPWSSPR